MLNVKQQTVCKWNKNVSKCVIF